MKEEVNCLICGKLVRVIAGKEGFTTEGICGRTGEKHVFAIGDLYDIG
jgi:hypothetical protein